MHPQPETYWGNVNPIGPRSVYDEAKRFAEAITMAYHREFGVDVRIVRIFNTYGPRMDPEDGRVVSNFIVPGAPGRADHDLRRRHPDPQLLLRRRRGRAASWRCSTATVTGPVNIGNDREFTMLELAAPRARDHRLVVRARLRAAARGRSHSNAGPTSRPPARDLGWEPTTSLRDGLERTVPYFRSAIGLD